LIYDACTQGAAAASSAASAAQKGVDMQTATNAAASTPGELYVKYIGTAVVSAGLVYGGYRVFFKFFGSAIKKDLGKKTPKEIKEMVSGGFHQPFPIYAKVLLCVETTRFRRPINGLDARIREGD